MASDSGRREPSDAGHLERTLGLPAALAIGVGTMVGAGIFVFPGIAAGQAGPAAMVSFALGGAVAFLVAVCTAELATAMPESGGGYHFVSRTFGPLVGVVVGVGQWVGLVFASAFYLVGFGQYAIDLLAEFGFSLGDGRVLVALGSALVLTGINLLGTRGAGRLQNGVVVTLTVILTFLFGYGVLSATGLVGEPQWPVPFAPKGAWPIFSTTALIFTSYLGFVQIATVGGEIKAPHRNLPRALMGSVVVVTVLYVLALFVSTSVLSTERLAELGETAMAEVARSLVGRTGALAILGAGLLATLSSANASILSSSRAVYALSRDRLVPGAVSRVSARFGTPYAALLAAGTPIAALTLLGRVELLAEVASFLHLVIYGLICLALPVLRRRRPLWYAPTFRVPGGLLLPALGALASFGVIAFMQPASQLVGGGVLLVALGWYAVYARGREVPEPHPTHIVPALRTPRILLPVEVPDPTPVPYRLLGAFRDLSLVVLAYQLVPEQTSPEQAREENGDEARAALDTLVDDADDHGIDVEGHLVFTPDLTQSLERYAEEEEAQAVLMAQPIDDVERLLVPLYDERQVQPRLATVLRDLAYSANLPVTVLALDAPEGDSEGEEPASADRLRRLMQQQLLRSGLPSDLIRMHTADTKRLVDAVADVASDGDLIILAEPSPSTRGQVFSTLHDDIQSAVSCPTLVVLRAEEEADGDSEDESDGGAAAPSDSDTSEREAP